jgi:hypothetical protein
MGMTIKYRDPRHPGTAGTMFCEKSQVNAATEDLLMRGLVIVDIKDGDDIVPVRHL